ncbi:hypothetical protein OXIME_000561 [Oxyplasma meridianum]|uniref:H/ACA RNA-protein complex protein Gar1 n=1 Tax=Oxyplasma meridianum TaxID=3073602 RepID=A0AAX4NH24_9ARCH
MEETCKVIGGKGRELVIKPQKCLRMNIGVFNRNNSNIGKITKIFGPVKDPYALVTIKENVSGVEEVILRC